MFDFLTIDFPTRKRSNLVRKHGNEKVSRIEKARLWFWLSYLIAGLTLLAVFLGIAPVDIKSLIPFACMYALAWIVRF